MLFPLPVVVALQMLVPCNTGDLNLGSNTVITGSLDVTGATSFNNPSGVITTGTLNVGTLSQQTELLLVQ